MARDTTDPAETVANVGAILEDLREAMGIGSTRFYRKTGTCVICNGPGADWDPDVGVLLCEPCRLGLGRGDA